MVYETITFYKIGENDLKMLVYKGFTSTTEEITMWKLRNWKRYI